MVNGKVKESAKVEQEWITYMINIKVTGCLSVYTNQFPPSKVLIKASRGVAASVRLRNTN